MVADEVCRQILPTKRGYTDVAAGHAIGTFLYFVLFNLGLIALVTPVTVPQRIRSSTGPTSPLRFSPRPCLTRKNWTAMLTILGIDYIARTRRAMSSTTCADADFVFWA
jgi:Ca2+/Na+ antiporter